MKTLSAAARSPPVVCDEKKNGFTAVYLKAWNYKTLYYPTDTYNSQIQLELL